MEKSCSCSKDYGTGGGKQDEDILADAALKHHNKCIENAVKGGADMNVISKALMRAVNLGDTRCTKILLTSVHDITKLEDDTALCSALWSADVNTIELLLQTGADVNRPLILGQTPLIWMTCRRRFNIVMLLVKSGADVNKPDENGQTPLMKAAWLEDENMVKLFIDSGADVNAFDQYGNTALLFSWAKVNCIRMLLQAGADVNRVNKTTGVNTLSSHLLNSRVVNRTIVELLSSAGEDVVTDTAGRRPASVPEYLKRTEGTLKHFCRETIRKRLLQMSKANLFVQVPKIGLPSSLAQCLLYDVSLEIR